MSDPIRHECGIAVVRLRKPLAYYHDKYKTALYGFQLIYQLMAKQRNRGQDGFGLGCCKLNMPPGQPYMFRLRSMKSTENIKDVLDERMKDFERLAQEWDGAQKERMERAVGGTGDPWMEAEEIPVTEVRPFKHNPEVIKARFDYAGEIYLGHLRYGTSGAFGKASLHPYIRRSNWPTRSLMVMGNFNLTNTRQLNEIMKQRGQHPVFGTDTQSVLEEIGFQLDEDHTTLYRKLRADTPAEDIPSIINRDLHMTGIVRRSAAQWDGGYTIAGAVGNGDLFVMRDPNGIRPCYYYVDEEIIVFASERAALRTVLEVEEEQTGELERGHVAVVKADGTFSMEPFVDQRPNRPCSFERIYFSRGNDATIYKERKRLGEMLVPQLVEAMGNDLANTVLSFIPNTAETAYYGMTEGLRKRRRLEVKQALLKMWESQVLDEAMLDDLILRNWPRAEKIAHKDVKMRTFISQEQGRDQMASQAYDITYGVVDPKDTLAVVDDSIVRGTTLRKSILRILARTNPRQIVILSTAPQIRYPDCYGIDMAEMGKFIAFQAAIKLLNERGLRSVIVDTYRNCKAELKKPYEQQNNAVKAIYTSFTEEEISAKIAQMVYPTGTHWKGEIRIIFQSIENLHKAISLECGDWYFSGDYPTPGGYMVANESYVRYIEGRPGRAWETLL